MHKCERCNEYAKGKYCKSCYKKVRSSNKCILCDSILPTNKERYCSKCRPLNIWANSKIRSKKQLNMSICFSVDWLSKLAFTTTHCNLCGKKLVYNAEGIYANFASLDRIDNEDVLTEDNTWIVCYKCNTTKSNRTLKEFIEYCTMISQKWDK